MPDWEKLKDISVWRKAAEQMFFSLSVSWGGLIMFGSYNKFRTKVHIHALAISSLDFVTSIIAGVVIFSILGDLKLKLGLDSIQEVVKRKQGLAFVVYPEAFSLLPLSQLWSVLFFLMLLMLGFDSQFCIVESLVTGLVDNWPEYLRPRRLKFTIFMVIFMFFLGIPQITQVRK